MADLLSYTVVEAFDLPHCEEGKHEHFGPCPDCDDKGMQPAGKGLFRKCKTCGGTRQGGPSLGMKPCDFPPTRYQPGQTVKLSAAGAKALLKDGHLAPPGAPNIEELQVRSAAKRLGILA